MLIDYSNFHAIEDVLKEERIAKINGYPGYYISDHGTLYSMMYPGLLYEINQSTVYGYKYANIYHEGYAKNFRIHRLVAEYFVPNDNPIENVYVSHEDNNKSNNHYSNLKWCNASYNTQKAYDEGLAKNSKGYEDSQSFPVIMYDKDHNEISRFGSVSEASKYTGYDKGTILNQCRGKVKTKVRKQYMFEFDPEYN